MARQPQSLDSIIALMFGAAKSEQASTNTVDSVAPQDISTTSNSTGNDNGNGNNNNTLNQEPQLPNDWTTNTDEVIYTGRPIQAVQSVPQFSQPASTTPALSLDPDQRAAVTNIMKSKLSILTGAAGTGKTFTVKAVLAELLKRYSLNSIFITAFTGKAVLNLINTFKSDSLLTPFADQSMTIHKFLAFAPEYKEQPMPDGSIKRSRIFVPTYNAINRRHDCRVLLIDEVSMVDTKLMEQLVAALDCRTLDKLILIGDINQLQPVIGTTSLASFAASPHCSINTLTKIHRQKDGNDIVEVANLIKQGNLLELKKLAEDNNCRNVKFIKAANQYDLYKVIDIIATKAALNFNDNQDCVITQTNVSATGQEILNNRLNKYLSVDKQLILCGIATKLIGVGDNVLFTKNNYEQGYINGTFGKVIAVTAQTDQPVYSSRNYSATPSAATTSASTNSNSNSDSTDAFELDADELDSVNAAVAEADEESFYASDASHSLTIAFTDIYGNYKEITLSSIGDISSLILANAITCYKAQGSTYKRCIVNLVDCKSGNTINNEYAYTAVTRAAEKVWIIYNDMGLAKIKNRQLQGVTDREKIERLVNSKPNELIDSFIYNFTAI